MELETINKLYLELSQFATATTARELEVRKRIAMAMQDLEYADNNGYAKSAHNHLLNAMAILNSRN